MYVLDREDLYFNVREIQSASTRTFEDLRFLVSDVPNPLKKVIIYGGSINIWIKIKTRWSNFTKKPEEICIPHKNGSDVPMEKCPNPKE